MSDLVSPVAAHVLYIDDDPGLGRLVRRALEGRGYVVALADSGEAGLKRLAQGGIDVVALDHHMPGQTGLDILTAIKELPNAPPVIYVTGSEDSRVAVAALKAGAVDYVWKDVQGHFRELLGEAISTALQQEHLRHAKEQAEREVYLARDRAEMLLREVNHRVANSLALVASFVAMQQKAVATVADPMAAREALAETQNRITAIAQVHRRLYTSQDVSVVAMDAYLTGLVEELEIAMRATGREHSIRLKADPEIRISTDKAVSIGIIVTELVTNAYKYAYPDRVFGDIRVMLRQVEAPSDSRRLSLTVSDDGVGWRGTGPIKGSGLGTRILRAMAMNLQAPLIFDPHSQGTCATLVFDA